jgi:hypothetical protein
MKTSLLLATFLALSLCARTTSAGGFSESENPTGEAYQIVRHSIQLVARNIYGFPDRVIRHVFRNSPNHSASANTKTKRSLVEDAVRLGTRLFG